MDGMVVICELGFDCLNNKAEYNALTTGIITTH